MQYIRSGAVALMVYKVENDICYASFGFGSSQVRRFSGDMLSVDNRQPFVSTQSCRSTAITLSHTLSASLSSWSDIRIATRLSATLPPMTSLGHVTGWVA